eukprot:scaffold93601_cov32-Tisochrysis_lutea.AAC.6
MYCSRPSAVPVALHLHGIRAAADYVGNALSPMPGISATNALAAAGVGELSTQCVPRTKSSSIPNTSSGVLPSRAPSWRRACTAQPTPQKRSLLMPSSLATSSRTASDGHRDGLVRRPLRISWTDRQRSGIGAPNPEASLAAAATMTASTTLFSSMASATDVATPVHCAPRWSPWANTMRSCTPK